MFWRPSPLVAAEPDLVGEPLLGDARAAASAPRSRRQRDPDPALVGPLAADQRSDRLDAHVRGQQEELDRDELLRRVSAASENIARAGEAPHDDQRSRSPRSHCRARSRPARSTPRPGRPRSPPHPRGHPRQAQPDSSRARRASRRTWCGRSGPAPQTASAARSSRREHAVPQIRIDQRAAGVGDRYITILPARRLRTRPAPRSTRRWCETRFSERSATHARIAHAQLPAIGERRRERQPRGSASALARSASSVAAAAAPLSPEPLTPSGVEVTADRSGSSRLRGESSDSRHLGGRGRVDWDART